MLESVSIVVIGKYKVSLIIFNKTLNVIFRIELDKLSNLYLGLKGNE